MLSSLRRVVAGGGVVVQPGGSYRVVEGEDGWKLQHLTREMTGHHRPGQQPASLPGTWLTQIRFDTQPRQLGDFQVGINVVMVKCPVKGRAVFAFDFLSDFIDWSTGAVRRVRDQQRPAGLGAALLPQGGPRRDSLRACRPQTDLRHLPCGDRRQSQPARVDQPTVQ